MIGSDTIIGANPFVGPRPLETGQPIFGRDREIEDLYYLLSAERIVLLHSPSGAGKSSLIRAGLIPRLAERFDVRGPTRVNTPPSEGSEVNRYVSSAILGFEQGLPEERRRADEAISGLSLADYVAGRPRRRSAPPNVVLVFDQFEEILTADPLNVAAKHEFFRQLGELLQNPNIWALFALREDYLAPLDPYADQVPTHLKNRFRIDLLSREAAQEAMVKTAAKGGRWFAPEAVEKLVTDLATMKVQQPDGSFERKPGPHIEPLHLQVTCMWLWKRMPADKPSIDGDDIESFGDVTDALATYYADEVSAEPQEERAIRKWFGEKLITQNGIRSQVLRGVGSSDGLDNTLIAGLVDAHLVRAEQRAGAVWYELAHDRLIDPVSANNQAWFDAHLSPVQKVAELWEEQDRPSGLLVVGEALAEAQCWANAQTSLTDVERAFLAASEEKQALLDKDRRQRRNLRWLAIVSATVSVLAVIAFLNAIQQSQKARESFVNATSIRLAVEGQAILAKTRPGNAFRGALEILAAHRIFPGLESYGAMQFAAQRLAPVVLLVQTNDDFGIAALSPDGKRIVSGSGKTLRLWDAGTGQPIGLPITGHSELVTSVAFSPNGQRIVSGDRGGALCLWDAETSKAVIEPIKKHGGAVTSVAFSPDGKLIVSASADSKLHLWDASSGQPIGSPLKGHYLEVFSAAFSPDSKRIVSGGKSGLYLWDTATGQPLGEPLSREGFGGVAFSPDGQNIVSGGSDRTVRVWDVATRKQVGLPFTGHTGEVSRVAFSLDGRRIVSASLDGNLRIWDAATGQSLGATLLGHGDQIWSVAFSRDGQSILSASLDHALIIWDAKSDRTLDSAREIPIPTTAIRFSRDGQRIVSGSEDGTLRVWDAATGKLLVEPFKAHDKLVTSVAFSPEGQRIVSGSEDGTLRLWDAQTGKPLGASVMEHGTTVTTVAFSPEGKRTVSGGYDATLSLATLRIWDAATGQPLSQPLTVHGKKVENVEFTPDGQRIVSGDDEHGLHLWDAATGRPLGSLQEGQKWMVTSLAFSPEYQRIVAASRIRDALAFCDVTTGRPVGSPLESSKDVNKVVLSPDGKYFVSAEFPSGIPRTVLRLGDAVTGRPVGIPHEVSSFAESLLFSPDGKSVATSGRSVVLTIWPVLDAWVDELCAKLPRNMTHKEWNEWVGEDIEYREQCHGKPIPPDETTAVTGNP